MCINFVQLQICADILCIIALPRMAGRPEQPINRNKNKILYLPQETAHFLIMRYCPAVRLRVSSSMGGRQMTFFKMAGAALMGLTLLLPTAALAATPKFDSGDTAWMLTSSALVLMMTIPGLALFYAGMVRKKNVLATLAQSFGATCIITVLWMIIGYSIAFTSNPNAGDQPVHRRLRLSVPVGQMGLNAVSPPGRRPFRNRSTCSSR